MSLWTDPIVIPPITIVYMGLGFLANKIIDRKAGKHLSDLERLDYVGDTLVNTSVKHGKKLKGTVKAILREDEELPSETIPGIQQQVNDIILQDGQALADMQLQLDNLQYRLKEVIPNLDLSNGDTAVVSTEEDTDGQY